MTGSKPIQTFCIVCIFKAFFYFLYFAILTVTIFYNFLSFHNCFYYFYKEVTRCFQTKRGNLRKIWLFLQAQGHFYEKIFVSEWNFGLNYHQLLLKSSLQTDKNKCEYDFEIGSKIPFSFGFLSRRDIILYVAEKNPSTNSYRRFPLSITTHHYFKSVPVLLSGRV